MERPEPTPTATPTQTAPKKKKKRAVEEEEEEEVEDEEVAAQEDDEVSDSDLSPDIFDGSTSAQSSTSRQTSASPLPRTSSAGSLRPAEANSPGSTKSAASSFSEGLSSRSPPTKPRKRRQKKEGMPAKHNILFINILYFLFRLCRVSRCNSLYINI